jgi:hypothetical protein
MWPAITGPGSARERALGTLLDVAEVNLPALVALQSEPGSPLHQPGNRGAPR